LPSTPDQQITSHAADAGRVERAQGGRDAGASGASSRDVVGASSAPHGATAPWSERRETATQIRRFLVIGFSSVAVDLGSYAGFVHWAGMPTMPAKGISYVLGMIVGFIGNKLWTFRSSRKNAAEPITYVILYAITLGVNIGVNEGLLRLGAMIFPDATSTTNLGKALSAFAALAATGVTTILNFLGMRFVTFRAGIADRRASSSTPSRSSP